MKKVTIQDIADELGVSRNTVSKAINNADGLAEATRERILQKAIEMGYKQFSYIKEQTRVSPEQEAPGKGEIRREKKLRKKQDEGPAKDKTERKGRR